MSLFTIHKADWASSRDRSALGKVRSLVNIRELGRSFDAEWDAFDANAHHFIAIAATGAPVGCLRLRQDYVIDRLCVLPQWRHQGIATALIERVIATARLIRTQRLSVEVAKSSVPYFQRFGFLQEGLPFLVDGVGYRRLTLPLATLDGTLEPEAQEEQFLGRSHQPLRLVGPEAIAAAATRMARQAQSHLYLFAPSLDPALFDTSEFAEACAQLARIHTRRNHIFCIFHSTLEASKRPSPLLALARRLSSQVQIRNTSKQQLDRRETLLLADNCGYILRKDEEGYLAQADYNNPLTTRRYMEFFRHAWGQASPDPYSRLHHA